MHSINKAAKLFFWIFHCFKSGLSGLVSSTDSQTVSNSSWMRLLVEAANTMGKAIVEEKELSTKLVQLGHRRRPCLTPIKSNNLFGLGHFDIIHLLTDAEESIRLLRDAFNGWPLSESSLIMRVNSGNYDSHQSDICVAVFPTKDLLTSSVVHTK